MAEIFKDNKYFSSPLHQQAETVHFQKDICINFVGWNVTSVSVIQSREISAI